MRDYSHDEVGKVDRERLRERGGEEERRKMKDSHENETDLTVGSDTYRKIHVHLN